jgi:hypothetical protein
MKEWPQIEIGLNLNEIERLLRLIIETGSEAWWALRLKRMEGKIKCQRN